MRHISLYLCVLALCTAFAFAQDPNMAPQGTPKTPEIHKRQMNQRARIRQGVKSGELTKKEAKNLRQEQKTIKAEKKIAKADGKVTPAERAEIRKDQNKASKDIYRKKHNMRTQPDQPSK